MFEDDQSTNPEGFVQVGKTLLRNPFVLLWILAIVILGTISVVLGIPMPSVFALHSPVIYLPLLLLIPFIIKFTDSSDNRKLPSLKGWHILLLFAIVMISLFTSRVDFFLDLYISFLFFFAIPFLLAILLFKIPIKNLGIRGNLKDILSALYLGIGYSVLIFILVGYNEYTESMYWIGGPSAFGFIPAVLPLAIFVFLVLVAIPEEFLFRVLIQSSLVERIGDINGILAASLIFGSVHIPTNFLSLMLIPEMSNLALGGAIMIAFLAQAQVGVIFGVAWHRTKSLILPVTLHTIHNLVEMLPLFLAIFLGIYFTWL